LLHGKTSLVQHDGRGVFQDLPSPFTATRYHSLAVEPETVGEDLEVTATTASGVIMGIRHTSHPVRGVQFHPESVLTEHGHHLLANWLVECGEQDAVASAAGLSPLLHV
jgi:para-aminobenzoate synthetase component 2